MHGPDASAALPYLPCRTPRNRDASRWAITGRQCAQMMVSPPDPPHRPFLTAEWRYLVMLNFKVAPQLLAPLVPRGTVLDSWRGDTWLSLVGFRFQRTRVFGIPVLGHRDFPEINLRFYVRPISDRRRAVVFVREIVPRRLIAVTARLFYNEPYVTRPMRAEAPERPREAPGRVTYSWCHRGRWNRFGVSAVGPPVLMRDASDEEFIADHYWGYTRQRDGSTVEYAVAHPRWRLWATGDNECDIDWDAEYGPAFAKALRGGPASAFLAEGSTVRVGRPSLLGGTDRPRRRSAGG